MCGRVVSKAFELCKEREAGFRIETAMPPTGCFTKLQSGVVSSVHVMLDPL